eukprot:6597646-Heterocapsa_arctica.AAC.1
MDRDMYGGGLEDLKDETGNRAEWGGAEQIIVFDGGELQQTVFRVLLGSFTKWDKPAQSQ